jgi:hypothetical protein
MESQALLAPRLRLALARGEFEAGRRLLDGAVARTFAFDGIAFRAARLDVLASARELAKVEDEAPTYLQRGTYLEPFALRALGIVREDEALIEQAQERFAALGLEWHAAQTDDLVRMGRSL